MYLSCYGILKCAKNQSDQYSDLHKSFIKTLIESKEVEKKDMYVLEKVRKHVHSLIYYWYSMEAVA